HKYEKRADGSLPTGVELLKLESAPLSVIAAQTMKPSQNMYTETLLWTLGEHERNSTIAPGGGAPVSTADSAELGIASVKKFLTGIGVAPDGIVQYDGSGLSRHNLITPSAVVQLYTYMAKQSRHSKAWRDSLTIGGVDGTLRNRFRGTRANNNVRGKTGTIDQVSALSGYVTTAAGEELVFSMVVNGVAQTSTRVGLIDEMVTHLANFNGRID
ncbi:MAG TPA: D-alanyl-D-alanine carboxypeptidase/D-alanyl-D-alanine-endopeptidase, partial [Pyrinomonadaceae bacterium]